MRALYLPSVEGRRQEKCSAGSFLPLLKLFFHEILTCLHFHMQHPWVLSPHLCGVGLSQGAVTCVLSRGACVAEPCQAPWHTVH